MSVIEAGRWMVSVTDPLAVIKVLSVAEDGGVRVRMSNGEATTTTRYLAQNYTLLQGES